MSLKNVNEVVSDVKQFWIGSDKVMVSSAGKWITNTFEMTLTSNPPPLGKEFPDFERLMELEWRKSTDLQIKKEPSLESKRFCTVLNLPNFKMGFLYMGRRTNYPRHSHTPEEIYHVIAGSCLRLCRSGMENKMMKVGDIWYHESEEAHGLQTDNSPVLIAWAWMGNLNGSYYFCDAPEAKIDNSYVFK